jgi:hypothetical protein
VELNIIVTKEALELVRSIETLDDIKQHKDEILSIIEDSIRFFIEKLKEIIKKDLSLEEMQNEMVKVQESQMENEKLYEEFEIEMNRISDIPGSDEYLETLTADLEARIEPLAKELTDLMGELMGAMMGGIMEGFGEMMSEAFDGDGALELETDGQMFKVKANPRDETEERVENEINDVNNENEENIGDNKKPGNRNDPDGEES